MFLKDLLYVIITSFVLSKIFKFLYGWFEHPYKKLKLQKILYLIYILFEFLFYLLLIILAYFLVSQIPVNMVYLRCY